MPLGSGSLKVSLGCFWQLHFALRALGDSSQSALCHGAAGGGSCFAPLQLYLPTGDQFLGGAGQREGTPGAGSCPGDTRGKEVTRGRGWRGCGRDGEDPCPAPLTGVARASALHSLQFPASRKSFALTCTTCSSPAKASVITSDRFTVSTWVVGDVRHVGTPKT